jgi:uncharacterized membrane protein YozB (DUF420 family)
MNALLNGPGFLGTNASFRSDTTLVLILFTQVLFTIGWRLALQKRFDAHRWVQTSAVILNTFVVLVTMISSFVIYILPGIPEKLNEGSYGVTTVHGVIGLVGMVLGVFIILQENNLVPKSLRFRNYKLFMRTSYLLYLLATILGVIVYIVVFVYGI